MSAGFRGAERVRRVRRVEWGGEMECVWRSRTSGIEPVLG